MPGKVPIEELLIDYGYLTRSQLERALQVARNSEAGVEETLLYLGYVTEAALLECSGILEHIPVIELDGYRTDEKAAAMLPAAFARMNRIIPIDLEDDRLVVASPYPFNPDVMDETATISGMEVKPVLALKLEVDRAIEKAYGRDGELEGDKGSGYAFGYITDNQGEKAFRERVESAPVVRLVNSVIEDAYVKNAMYLEAGNRGTGSVFCPYKITRSGEYNIIAEGLYCEVLHNEYGRTASALVPISYRIDGKRMTLLFQLGNSVYREVYQKVSKLGK